MSKPKIKRIHVNQHHIRANGKDGGKRPVISVKTGGKNYVGHEVFIQGPSRVVYQPEKPLACGAKVWIETKEDVLLKETNLKTEGYIWTWL